jgi:hypothetical protein
MAGRRSPETRRRGQKKRSDEKIRDAISTKKQMGILVLYGANTGTGGVKSTNCVKIARCPRLVSYNNEANVRIVKIAKPRR